MSNVFVDTEFTILNMQQMKPVSIAFVDDTGQKCFYAEFTDTYHLNDCHPFVVENVLPYLRRGEYEMSMATVRARLYDYFDTFSDTVRIWSDAPDWDEIIVHEIFPPNLLTELDVWPDHVEKHINGLQYYGDDATRFSKIQKELFSAKRSSLRDKHVGRRLYQHNALDDAMANYIGWLMVGKKFSS